MSDNLRRYIIRVVIINIVSFLIFRIFSKKSDPNPSENTYTTGINIQQMNGDINAQLDKLLKE